MSKTDSFKLKIKVVQEHLEGTLSLGLMAKKYNISDKSFPLQKLLTDEIKFKCLNDEKLYLSAIMDLYNRKIIWRTYPWKTSLDF